MCDIKDIANDDKFFLFEDEVLKVCQLFYRDRYVLENMSAQPHAPIVGIAGTDRVIGPIPPAGVLPFKGFAYYVAALCYVSDKPPEIYYLMRAIWCRHLCHIHSISSHPKSIISLCKTFEDLL